MVTWPATISPRQDIQVSLIDLNRRYQMGDGYEQRTKQGVNPFKLEVSASFVVQGDETDATSAYFTLRNFLIQNGQTTPFTFDVPGYGPQQLILSAPPRQRSLGWKVWEFQLALETWNAVDESFALQLTFSTTTAVASASSDGATFTTAVAFFSVDSAISNAISEDAVFSMTGSQSFGANSAQTIAASGDATFTPGISTFFSDSAIGSAIAADAGFTAGGFSFAGDSAQATGISEDAVFTPGVATFSADSAIASAIAEDAAFSLDSAWDPSQLATAPYFWGNTESAVSASGGVNIDDLSGNSNHLILPTGAGLGRPSQSASGQPIIFDGVDDVLRTTSTTDFNTTQSWVFILYTTGTLTNYPKTAIATTSSNTDLFRAYRNTSSLFFVRYSFSGLGVAIADNETLLLSIKLGTNRQIWKNGTQLQNVSVSRNALEGFSLGARYSVSGQSITDPGDFSLYELVVTGNDLTTQEQQQIEGYMMHNNGFESLLDAGHPYKNAPP